jgi:glutamyl-tRNA synthetase
MKIFTRIAPTPSGYLHIGNIFSFLLTRAIADKSRGKVLLRIDDLDADRTKPAYLQDIFETLRFLGIRYEMGPKDPLDFSGHYSQTLRIEQYNSFLKLLEKQGILYACTCSRKELLQLAEDGFLRCGCREKKLPLSTLDAAWRIYVPADTIKKVPCELNGMLEVNLFAEMGDFVVRRRDGFASYQVTSLVDDIFYGVNYIVRGYDLLASSAAQLYLAHIVGDNLFSSCRFLHHPLLTDANGHKLSKSAGSNSIKQMAEKGLGREEILAPIVKSVDTILEKIELPLVKPN